MEIKTGGPGGPYIPPSPQNVDGARPASVERSKAPAEVKEPSEALKGISARYRKSDLQDPAKLEEMISTCVGELLDSASSRTGKPLSENDKTLLAGWMGNDPTVRSKVVTCLEQTLK
jgi:hypothetical protein